MIDLSIDISYLSRFFGVTPTVSQVGISDAQRAQGDEAVTIKTKDGQITVNKEILQKLIQDPEKMAKILKLADPENRYLIIRELNEEDLGKLIPFLNSQQLAVGLQFFTLDGLSNLMTALPREELVNLLLIHFTMDDVVPFMQENEMDRFFENPNLDKNDVLEYFQGLEYQKFQALMVNQFGPEYKNKTPKEYLEKINSMENKEYKRFLSNMRQHEKGEAISGLCAINPDYYLEFENSILVRPIINKLETSDIIKTMSNLDPEFLVPMINELPKDLMQIVATQIDPTEFSKILSSEFPELIVEMLGNG